MMYYDVTCYQILSNESVIIQYNENCKGKYDFNDLCYVYHLTICYTHLQFSLRLAHTNHLFMLKDTTILSPKVYEK